MHARKNFSPALALKSWCRSFHFCATWAPRAPNLHVALAGPSPGPPTPPGRGASLFPAKREVKRELSKAWQAWPGNQTSSRCLVRSLVLLGRRAPHPDDPRRCPMESGASTARVHGAPGGTRGRPRPPGPGGHAPKKRSGKKSPEISLALCLRKVGPSDDFRACRGRVKNLNFCRRP